MELTIDTASPVASVALSDGGSLVAETTWLAGRGHAAELTPVIDRVLRGAGMTTRDLAVVFVNRGPGGYAGLRVGVSTALAIASALEADLLGFGRLQADALPYLALGRPVCAVHDAGRGEFAWATYSGPETSAGLEIAMPATGDRAALVAALPPDVVVVGDGAEAARGSALVLNGGPRRAATGAALAWRRYASGQRDDRRALTPIYLRAPNITTPRAEPRRPGGVHTTP